MKDAVTNGILNCSLFIVRSSFFFAPSIASTDQNDLPIGVPLVTTTELYQQGKLQEAIDAQIAAVKSKPADQKLRLFLFELFAFAGEFERAQKQIDALKFDEPELLAAAVNYRQCLESELVRRRVFKEGISPQFLKAPPEHLKLRLEALQQLRGGDAVAAKATLDKAEDVTPSFKGVLNDKPFEFLRDPDDLFGPVLEVFAKGNYFWVPLEEIDLLASNPPKFPRDLMWLPANLQVKEGPAGEVFLPAIYPGSSEHADPLIKLGRANDWLQAEGGPVRGAGLRILLVDDADFNLLDVRQITAEGAE
jgi:type VI secretion system protein ImpE